MSRIGNNVGRVMTDVMHVVSVSGGKDSTVTLALACLTQPRESIRAVFFDTGNEYDRLLVPYLDYLEERFGIRIERLRADFTRVIANKRMFIARDQRIGRRNGRRIRWSNKAKRRALAVLHPTGNPFLDLCLWKGRFPSRKAQFCTQHLKTEMARRYELALADDGYEVVSWQGVRRDESENRRNVLVIEEAAEGIWQYRPIADWAAAEVFEFHLAHGIKPNPLYRMGMTRVGCMPCVNVGKADMREIALRFPEEIERIAHWERLVSQASKRGGASFIPNLDREEVDKSTIYKVVEWAQTARGGKQILMSFDEPAACASAYGLCE